MAVTRVSKADSKWNQELEDDRSCSAGVKRRALGSVAFQRPAGFRPGTGSPWKFRVSLPLARLGLHFRKIWRFEFANRIDEPLLRRNLYHLLDFSCSAFSRYSGTMAPKQPELGSLAIQAPSLAPQTVHVSPSTCHDLSVFKGTYDHPLLLSQP